MKIFEYLFSFKLQIAYIMLSSPKTSNFMHWYDEPVVI